MVSFKEFDKRLRRIEKSVKPTHYQSVYFANSPFNDEMEQELLDKGIIDEDTVIFIEDVDIYD